MSSFKKLTSKGTLRQVFIRFYRLEIHAVMLVFRPSFVNCSPSNLLSGSKQSPLPNVNKFTVIVCTYTGCKGESMGVWASDTDKHLPQSPFTGQFFRWRHFALSSISLFFLRRFPYMVVRHMSLQSPDSEKAKSYNNRCFNATAILMWKSQR